MFDILIFLCINIINVINPLIMLNIVFFSILCLLIYALREINRNLNQEKGFLTQINSLYIRNIYLTCFKITLYICGTLVLLLILRYLNLGSTINLSPIAIHNKISVSSVILIIEILIIIILFVKFRFSFL